jgi:hypothetical protein
MTTRASQQQATLERQPLKTIQTLFKEVSEGNIDTSKRTLVMVRVDQAIDDVFALRYLYGLCSEETKEEAKNMARTVYLAYGIKP